MRAILLLLLTSLAIVAAPQHEFQIILHAASAATARATPAKEAPSEQEKHKPKESRASRKRTKREGQVQTLIGRVEWEYKPFSWDCDVPNCDHFALYDDATQNNYELDDARAALPYEGKRVKVTGIVDTKNSSIHVISIEEVK
jgi:hypothetical protein